MLDLGSVWLKGVQRALACACYNHPSKRVERYGVRCVMNSPLAPKHSGGRISWSHRAKHPRLHRLLSMYICHAMSSLRPQIQEAVSKCPCSRPTAPRVVPCPLAAKNPKSAAYLNS